MRVVGMDFKPAPDAQDRLRRLFTILARVVEDHPPIPTADQSVEDDAEEER